jgi:predicted O-methyltransferase YrrM
MLTITRADIEVARIRSFPNTYLNEVETALLVTLVRSVKPQVMVEIGCQEGRTAKIILDNVSTLRRYIGIDVPPDYEPTLACQRGEIPRSAGVYAAKDPRFFLLLRKRGSLDVGPQDLDGECIDAIFIDGDHSERAVAHDSHLARALVRPGGVICWHDYNNSAVEVTAVLERLSRQGWPIVAIEGSWLAYMRII